MNWTAWEFVDRFAVRTGESLVGYAVLATDGPIGRVHSATTDVGTSHLVVDTEDFGSGELVVLPAGVVDGIDTTGRQIHVERTLAEIEQAPTLSRNADDPHFYDRLEDYYGGYYWTAPADAISRQAREEAALPEHD